MAGSYAVLTGDLMNSSDLDPAALDAAMDSLRDAALDFGGTFGRRGGDGWQCAAPEPANALRYALILRAALRSLRKDHATRIAIAAGAGTLPASGDVNAAHGPAFTASGRLLEAMPAHVGMADAAGGAQDAATRLADHISSGWTPAQARSVRLILWPKGRIRADAAAALGITRQAVDQALWSAGFPALSDALDLIEGTA
ncbi:MAG TPA: MarR family transcriptional regulator [Roseovarius sp.]